MIVQPVHLTNDEEDFDPAVSLHGDTERMRVSRGSVGRFLVRAVESPEFAGRSVAVSGALPVGHARRPATLIDGLPS